MRNLTKALHSTEVFGHCTSHQSGPYPGSPTLKYSFSNCYRYKKTVPQLLIRWNVQKDYITIPKSTKPERIQENADIFDFTISDGDMKTLVRFIKLTGATATKAIFRFHQHYEVNYDFGMGPCDYSSLFCCC